MRHRAGDRPPVRPRLRFSLVSPCRLRARTAAGAWPSGARVSSPCRFHHALSRHCQGRMSHFARQCQGGSGPTRGGRLDRGRSSGNLALAGADGASARACGFLRARGRGVRGVGGPSKGAGQKPTPLCRPPVRRLSFLYIGDTEPSEVRPACSRSRSPAACKCWTCCLLAPRARVPAAPATCASRYRRSRRLPSTEAFSR